MIFEKAIKQSWGNGPIKLHEMDIKEKVTPSKLKLSELDFQYLSYGFIPREMDDKWFTYMDDKNVLRLYRSWTGFLIAEYHFKKQGKFYHIEKLFLNRNKEQCTTPYLHPLINISIKFIKDHIKICSYCFNKIEKNDERITDHSVGYKKKDNPEITYFIKHYHKSCFHEKIHKLKLKNLSSKKII